MQPDQPNFTTGIEWLFLFGPLVVIGIAAAVYLTRRQTFSRRDVAFGVAFGLIMFVGGLAIVSRMS